jgi:DNA-binding SARP family transcriptional activator
VRRALAQAGRLLRAAAGTGVAVALLAGLPWGLARFTGSPLPRTWPGWQQAQRFLASPLSDDAIIRALADAAWLLWAVFVLTLAVELIAVTRGQPAPRLPVIAPVQALAAALVGATMVTALHAPRAAPRSAQPLHAALASATVISAPLVPGHPAHLTAAVTSTAARAASAGGTAQARPKVYRVRENDDLWVIAERYLGDPEAWHQIYQLNEGKPQPDGRSLTDPNLIIPGWVLLIPQPVVGHATPHPHPGHPASPSPRPSRPASPPAQPSQPASPSPRPSQTAPDTRPSARSSTPVHGTRPGNGTVRLPSGALIGIGVAVMVAAALTLAAVQRRRRYRPRPGPPSSLRPETPPLPEVISALRRATRAPAPGEDPDGGAPGEEDPYLILYDSADDPATVRDGGPDASPGASPAGPARPVPEPDAHNPGEDEDLDLYTAAPAPAPVPGDGRAVPPRARPVDPGPRARAGAGAAERPAAAARGIPVGTRDGAEATADIAALSGLGLAGPGAAPAARAIIATLLAQALPGLPAMPPAIIIPAADAARLLPGADPAAVPGLSVPATLEAALDELEALVLTLARTAVSYDDDGTDPPEPGAGGPAAVLVATCAPSAAARLAAIVESGRPLGATAVMLGTWPTGTTCTVAADGTVAAVTPPAPALDGVRLFTLSSADAAAITGLLREASEPAPDPLPPPDASKNEQPRHGRSPQPSAGPAAATAGQQAAGTPASPEAGPDRPEHASSAVGAGPPPGGAPAAPESRRPVQLRLLGELRITAGGQEVGGGLRKARELLAFLAVHPDGASGEAISEALWPEADPGRATGQRNLALRKARELLRTATGLAAPMWIINTGGRYQLDTSLIGTDLQAFASALEQARQSSGQERLAAARAAVALYDGELAGGTGYEWAEPYAETARRRALDAWTTIAEILQPSHPDEALSALEAALAHDPYNEYLYQRIMRLQAAAGRPEAVRRTLALLESRLTDLGITPGTQTRQVAAALLGPPSPRPAVVADHEKDAGS